MSWSFEFTGTRDAVLARVQTECERIAKQYEGSAEAADVATVGARAIALIQALDLTPDNYTNWNAVTVKAEGSHSTSATKVWSANFTLAVQRIALAL